MLLRTSFPFSVIFLFLLGCTGNMTEEEIESIGREKGRKPAPFISQLGMNPYQSAFSSSVKNVKGIVLIQAVKGYPDSFLQYQHPSWSEYGWMGSITTDTVGNAYTAPIPFVNTLIHSLSSINTIYKIDAHTGIMQPFIQLPPPDSIAGVVPFGVLGLYYDLHGNKLYASSIAGSTAEEEKGTIYVIDIGKASIVDSYKGIDAMGLFVGGITGEKKLYMGTCRTSEIKSILLDKKGNFASKKIETELSLEQLGSRGDDKARRIRYDKFGNLLVYGIEFDYNLTANSEQTERFYKFAYNKEQKKWVLLESY